MSASTPWVTESNQNRFLLIRRLNPAKQELWLLLRSKSSRNVVPGRPKPESGRLHTFAEPPKGPLLLRKSDSEIAGTEPLLLTKSKILCAKVTVTLGAHKIEDFVCESHSGATFASQNCRNEVPVTPKGFTATPKQSLAGLWSSFEKPLKSKYNPIKHLSIVNRLRCYNSYPFLGQPDTAELSLTKSSILCAITFDLLTRNSVPVTPRRGGYK